MSGGVAVTDALTAVGIFVAIMTALVGAVWAKLDRHGRKLTALEIKMQLICNKLGIHIDHTENGD